MLDLRAISEVNMKAEITIYRGVVGFFAEIEITHEFLNEAQILTSRYHKSKGQLKRKAIQFCADLNLDYVISD